MFFKQNVFSKKWKFVHMPTEEVNALAKCIQGAGITY